MKDSNHPQLKIRSRLKALLPLSAIRDLSRTSGFIVRAARKISALDFVMSFFLCCASRKASLSNWASKLCIVNSGGTPAHTPSRQAICKRLTEACSTFAEALLAHLLKSRISTAIQTGKAKAKTKGGVLHFFPKVLVQDSTTICLPGSLAAFFKGNFSKGTITAVARIQCIVDIRSMCFEHFQLGSYCDNDQGAASQIHHLVSKGTLVIRDLGYFALQSLKQVADKKGYFLSRLRYGLCLYNPDGKELGLRSLLRSFKTATGIDVLAGKECRLPARLIIVPLCSRVASERRRKARQHRDKRLNHSKEYMEALGYQIMITNVGADIWTAAQAAEAYRLRWTIECIFKGFKSAGMHMDELCSNVRVNAERARSTLLLALCFIMVQMTSLSQLWYGPRAKETAGSGKRKRHVTGPASTDQHLSLNKALSWICDNYILWISSPPALQQQYLEYCCCYEPRKDRINITKRLQYVP